MKYMTSIERLSREEGLLRKRLATGLRHLFEKRFGPICRRIDSRREQIFVRKKRILTASSPDEVLAT